MSNNIQTTTEVTMMDTIELSELEIEENIVFHEDENIFLDELEPISQTSFEPISANWQALYGSSTHDPMSFNCSEPTGTGYDLRKGTITLAGDNTWYIPGGDTTYKSRTGDDLIRPQPDPTKGEAWCYNRQTGMSQDTWGYTLLKFNISLVGLNEDGSQGLT